MVRQPIYIGGVGNCKGCTSSLATPTNIDTHYVVYGGIALSNLTVNSNDTLDVILGKLNTVVGTGGSGGGTVNSVNSVTPVSGNVTLTKSNIGLGNIDNTSDAGKPISDLTQAALGGKQGVLPTGTILQYFRGDTSLAIFPTLLSQFTNDVGFIGGGSTPSNGQMLIGNGVGYTLNTLTAGSNINITNGAGGITINAIGTAGGGVSIDDSSTSSTTTTWSANNANNKIIVKTTYLDDITALGSFVKASVTSVHVRDLRRGGHFQFQASGYTVDNGVVFAATGGGYWVRQFNLSDGINVDWWGSVPDGATDTRVFFNSGITYLTALGGGRLNFSAGSYSFSTTGSPGRALNLYGKTNISIRGVKGSTTLKLVAGDYPADVFFIGLDSTSSYITIRDLIVDGNKDALGVTNEQIHGLQIGGSKDVNIEDCTFQNWFGDGMRLLGAGGVDESLRQIQRVRIDKNYFLNCHRSGITCQRDFEMVTITNNFFKLINDQSIDYEPTGQRAPSWNVISDNIIESSTAGICFTLSGISSSDTNKRTIVANNIVKNGIIQAISMENMIIEGNIFIGDVGSSAPATLDFDRACNNITITDNVIVSQNTNRCISMTLGSGNYPSKINITNNQLITDNVAVYMDSPAGDVIISNNLMKRFTDGTNGGKGVFITSTGVNPLCRNFQVCHNQFNGFDTGVTFNGASSASAISNVIISENIITNTEGIAGIILSGSSSPGTYISQPILISNNQISSSIKIQNILGGPSYYFTKGDDYIAYSTIVSKVTPEGAVTAALDSQCIFSGVTYRKTTASGNTGWIAPSAPGVSAPSQAYTGTLVFNGTAPTTPNGKTYSWNQNGNCVDYTIHLNFNVGSGTNNTQLVIPFPGDMPAPIQPAGFNGASDILFLGAGYATTGTTVSGSGGVSVRIRRNSANNGFEWVMVLTASAYKTFWVDGHYFTS